MTVPFSQAHPGSISDGRQRAPTRCPCGLAGARERDRFAVDSQIRRVYGCSLTSMRHIVVLLVSALGFFGIGTAVVRGDWVREAGSGRHRAFSPGLVGRALHRRIRRPLFLVIHRPSTRRAISGRVRPPDLRRLGSDQRKHSLWDTSLRAGNKSPRTDGVGVSGQRKKQSQNLPALFQRPCGGTQQPGAGHS